MLPLPTPDARAAKPKSGEGIQHRIRRRLLHQPHGFYVLQG
jgi:hypothetical protein